MSGDHPAPQSTRPAARSLRGTVLVTRQVHFNAAHRLENPGQPDDWNRETYGLCNSPNWHGHNYLLEVSVAGEPDPVTGYVIDLGELKAILQREVVSVCDHRNLNLDVEFLRGIIPTTENLAIAIWERLEPHIRGGRLFRVRIFETERNSVEYFGPGGPRAV
jgi:6-pyruvoyltetrahydropterin/6-carboxytetrahydropterin synthase